MTTDTRIGLVAGLTVITLFALLLSRRDVPTAQQPPPDPTATTAVTPPAPTWARTPQTPQPTPGTLPGPIPSRLPGDTAAAAPPEESSPSAVPPDARDQPPAAARAADHPAAPTGARSPEPQPSPRSQTEPARERPAQPAGRPPRPAHPARDRREQLRRLLEPSGLPREYVAQAHDTLTAIARRFYGTEAPPVVRWLFEANRDTLSDPDRLLAGQRLRLPPISQMPGFTPAEPGAPGARAAVAAPAPRTDKSARTYLVRPGDTYVSIARSQLGDPRRWREIYELNRDRFPDPDRIEAGVTIRLPPSNEKRTEVAQR